MRLAHPQYVADSFHRHNQCPGVFRLQHRCKRFEYLHLNQLQDLRLVGMSRAIANCPDCLFPHPVVVKLKHLDQLFECACEYDHLNLICCACSYVGECPTCFTTDVFVEVGQQVCDWLDHSKLDYFLCYMIVLRQQIADCAK